MFNKYVSRLLNQNIFSRSDPMVAQTVKNPPAVREIWV